MKSRETINPLLLHCEGAMTLWMEIFQLPGIEGVMPFHVVELMLAWGGRRNAHRGSKVRRIVCA